MNREHFTPQELMTLYESMSAVNQRRFLALLGGHFADTLPPTGPDDLWDDEGRAAFVGFFRSIAEMHAADEVENAMIDRNRGSDAEIVRRNVEICDSFKSGKLTQGQLAKKHELSRARIGQIIKEEAKWRELMASN